MTLGRLWIVLAAACLAACGSTTPASAYVRGSAAFMQIGVTTREETLLQFGPPSAVYEDERVFAWRFVRGDSDQVKRLASERRLEPAWPHAGRYASVVATFDASGVVARWSLVDLQ